MKNKIFKILIICIIILSIFSAKLTFSSVVVLDNEENINSETPIVKPFDIIEGKDGWLFFDPYINDNVRADYLGLNLFTKEELKFYLDKLVKIKNKLAKRGIDFYIFLAPNKNRIYSEYYLDDIGEMSQVYRLQQFIDYMVLNSDIKIVYPLPELLYTKNRFPDKLIYHKYDSHWNALGGYVGAYSLLLHMGINIPDVHNIKITEIEGEYYDLVELKGLDKNNYKDIDYKVTYNGEPTSHSVSIKEYSIANYISDKPLDDRKVLMCIDSYYAAMINPLANVCNNILSVMHTDFNKEYFDEYKPDVFVLEILERSLKNRLDHIVNVMETFE